jgi:hypothetical protein
MGGDATPSDLIAIGISLGAVAALAQRPLVRLRARLHVVGRTALAWTTYPASALVLLAALVTAAGAGSLAGCAFVVGLVGTRVLVIGDPIDVAGP